MRGRGRGPGEGVQAPAVQAGAGSKEEVCVGLYCVCADVPSHFLRTKAEMKRNNTKQQHSGERRKQQPGRVTHSVAGPHSPAGLTHSFPSSSPCPRLAGVYELLYIFVFIWWPDPICVCIFCSFGWCLSLSALFRLLSLPRDIQLQRRRKGIAERVREGIVEEVRRA